MLPQRTPNTVAFRRNHLLAFLSHRYRYRKAHKYNYDDNASPSESRHDRTTFLPRAASCRTAAESSILRPYSVTIPTLRDERVDIGRIGGFGDVLAGRIGITAPEDQHPFRRIL